MTASDSPTPSVPPSFSTQSKKEAASLVCYGHKRCTVYSDLVGRCTFDFEDSPALRKDLERIRADKAAIEPGRFLRVLRQLGIAMSEAQALTRAEAEADPEFQVALSYQDWLAREQERHRVASQPSAWAALRAAQAAASGRQAFRNASQAQRSARPWRDDTMSAPPADAAGDEKGA